MSIISSRSVVTIVAACAGLATTPALPARSQTMCVASKASCEHDADEKLSLCASHCARYDNACTDFCDDAHDTAVRYCWITRTVCAEIERPKQAFSVSTRREDAPR
jgi:hypothetical protein